MCDWVELSVDKPKPGQRFIGAGKDKKGRDEWNLFTAPNHDLKDDQGNIEMTKEEHLDKIIQVYQLTKWTVPKI